MLKCAQCASCLIIELKMNAMPKVRTKVDPKNLLSLR